MRWLSIITAFILVATGIAHGQTTQPTAIGDATTAAADPDKQATGTPPEDPTQHTVLTLSDWSFYASAMTYVVPHDRSYVQPTITADRGWLHLEARYNYEALDTGSLFAGYNFSMGDKLTLEFTPMVGVVFGNTNGVAPGYKFTLAYEGFELYSEGEYLFDTGDSSGNFFYTWSEFTYSPTDWLRFGIVIQRTRAYQTDLDIQRGLLLGLTYKQVNITGYVLNPGWDNPTFALSIGAQF